MKRIIALSLAALMLSGLLIGCTSSDTPGTTPTPTPSATPSPSPESTPEATPETTPEDSEEPGDSEEPTYTPPEPATGPLADKMTWIIEKATELLDNEFGFGDTEEVFLTAETSQGYLGVTPEDFTAKVNQAVLSNALIDINTHQVVLVECTDAAAAEELSVSIAEGFDPGRWICVTPDECFVMTADNIVMMAVSSTEGCTALKAAFGEAYENAGEANVFYTKPTE